MPTPAGCACGWLPLLTLTLTLSTTTTGAHACRLRLWVATRCCPELVCPWSPGEQLQAYLAKMHHLPPACHLTPSDELELLRRFAPLVDAAAATRRAFLEATLAPSAGYHPNSAPLLLTPAYPPAARARADHDVPLDPSSLAGGGTLPSYHP